jgi:hypothetical protein
VKKEEATDETRMKHGSGKEGNRQRTEDRGQRAEDRGYWHTVTTPGGHAGSVGPAIGGGFWDEVKGIILERMRHGAPKEMGRGE